MCHKSFICALCGVKIAKYTGKMVEGDTLRMVGGYLFKAAYFPKMEQCREAEGDILTPLSPICTLRDEAH